MASTDLPRSQHLAQLHTWTGENETLEPASFYESYNNIDDAIMYWGDANTRGSDSGIDSIASASPAYTYASQDSVCTFPDGASDIMDTLSETLSDSVSSLRSFADSNTERSNSESPATTTFAWDLDIAPDEGSQRAYCSHCNRTFENLGALDKHAQSTSHKAWSCTEVGCGKRYTRRDTFLRHKSTHKESNHACSTCLKNGKQKFFKRKDHLKEHMRNCHPSSANGTRPSRSDQDPACNFAPECGVDRASTAMETEISTVQQQQAMKDLVKSLGTVLGDRHPNLIGKLGVKVTAMSGQDMESIAESMAVSALAKAYFTAPETYDCPWNR